MWDIEIKWNDLLSVVQKMTTFYSVQEILARGVLLPLINQLSDPDYINQFIIWMVSLSLVVYVFLYHSKRS